MQPKLGSSAPEEEIERLRKVSINLKLLKEILVFVFLTFFQYQRH